jgi:hypothetical protein
VNQVLSMLLVAPAETTESLLRVPQNAHLFRPNAVSQIAGWWAFSVRQPILGGDRQFEGVVISVRHVVLS